MSTDKKLAYLVLRLALGMNMFIHGVGRLGSRYDKFVGDTLTLFAKSPLPEWSVVAFVQVIPYFEAIIGLFVLVGFLSRYFYLLGSLLMLNLIFGMGVIQRWDIVGLQMTYVIIYFLLLFFNECNRYSVDGILLNKKSKLN